MEFNSINPFNGSVVNVWKGLTDAELQSKLDLGQSVFPAWKAVPLSERAALMRRAGAILLEDVDTYARMITLEVGKPLTESRAEIRKCAMVCDYYANHAAEFLAHEVIASDARSSYVRHDPLGGVLAIMPWNFPFWQVFRFAAPTLIAGNTGLLKHAPNVFGSATLIEQIFEKAGFPTGVFQNLIVHHDRTAQIIAHDSVRAVTLTGSEGAGSAVAAIAGKHLKKTLLELGGNNAFIVLADADLEATVKTALTARMLNCGQSCIAAKRFLIVESVYDAFVESFTKSVQDLKAGDPMEEDTQVGPLARKDLADQLQRQVQDSIAMGATLVAGGTQEGCYHQPTILTNVTTDMPAFREETFGPLAAIVKVASADEAIELSELSRYGLGVTVCTQDLELAASMAERVSDGAFFVNELVKSDPRLPFGGTKKSGYGRELSRDGILEFVNRKTVYIK